MRFRVDIQTTEITYYKIEEQEDTKMNVNFWDSSNSESIPWPMTHHFWPICQGICKEDKQTSPFSLKSLVRVLTKTNRQ
jgi:hypothetical protein